MITIENLIKLIKERARNPELEMTGTRMAQRKRKKRKHIGIIDNVGKSYLNKLKPRYISKGFAVPRWIYFCEAMIDLGYSVTLKRAKTTVSKYVYIRKGNIRLKIRFSNHKPNKHNECNVKDCDYYIGVGHLGTITTDQVINLIKQR